MAQPAGIGPEVDEPPIPDPSALEREIRLQRARRSARIERERARKHARLRYWFVLGGLFLGVLVLAVTIWDQIGRIFGL
jgi:hypothetical protein